MIKTGDVFSINTSNGLAYFQFVKQNKLMGSLIRVLPGIHGEEPSCWEDFVGQSTKFWIFFPVSAALKNGIIRKVANHKVPDHAKEFPLFRAGVRHPETGKVETWWLWDGEKEWPVGDITEDERKLPIRASWNDTMLVQRIQEGWLPENDPR